jgi:hypothetical protein
MHHDLARFLHFPIYAFLYLCISALRYT